MTRTTTVTALALSIVFVSAGHRPAASGHRSALHTHLESSVPARDSVIHTALEHVQLVFSGPVEAELSRVRWVGPAGDTVTLRVSAVPDRPHVLVTPGPPAANGPQSLLWRTVAIDGHQVSGEIPFSADIPGLPAADTTTAAAAADSAEAAPPEQQAGAAEETGLPISRLIVRGLGMLCLLGFAGLLWFGTGTTLLAESRVHRIAAVLGLGATVLLALDVLLWLSGLRLPGTDLAETFSAVIGTRSGLVEVARAVLAAAAFLLFAGTRAVRLGALIAMLAVVAGALGGHQAAIRPLISLPANGLHLGAAAVWTGGLLLLGAWPTHPEPDVDVGWTFPRVALRVSSAALLASATILVTGIVQELLYLPSIGSLFSSTYGNLLLAKMAGFLALVGFGAYNRFRLIPELTEVEAGGQPLRRSVRVELFIVIVVVLVAVALAQASPPIDQV